MAIVKDLSGNSPIGFDVDGHIVGGDGVLHPDDATTVIAYTGTAGNGTKNGGLRTRFRISPTTDCFYKIGVDAVATANDVPLAANVVEFVEIRRGERISVIQSAAGGNLHVTPVD